MKTNKNYFLFLVLISFSFPGIGQQKVRISLDDLNQQLENPISKYWTLIFQENLNFNSGEAIDGTVVSNVFSFQPSLPVQVFNVKRLLIRPSFPLISSPIFDGNGNKIGTETGFGDMQIFSLYGGDKKEGLIWGGGLAVTLPTATSEHLGSGKYQLGPAFMAILNTKQKWTFSVVFQHFNSVGGDSDRMNVTRTDLQYIIRKQIPGTGMSIGTGPHVTINWEAEDGDKLTLPIGIGVTKIMKWGTSAWKLQIEPQYSIVKPDNYGTRWNLGIQIAPVITDSFLKKTEKN